MAPRDIGALRDFVALRVEGSSLRAIAAECGVPRQSLLNFLGGATPYGPNLNKLWAWHDHETNELARLRRELEEVKRKLKECEGKLGKR